MLKAKVVLSDRDVDAWYDSWWRTMGRVLQIIETPPMSWILKTQENPKMKQVWHFFYLPIIALKRILLC